MQTFLPFPDFVESAGALDRQRLGKQRVEVVQILNVLHQVDVRAKQGWVNHPAVRMWRGYEVSLCEYGLIICEEWIARGYKDSCKAKIETHLDWATGGAYEMDKPGWFGDVAFHLSHQSNLIRKDPDFYGPQFPGVPNDLPYIWPVS